MQCVGDMPISRPAKRREDVEGLLAWGSLYSADFSERTLEFRIEGDMPTLRRGRYAIIDAERLRMLVMRANLWTESQRKGDQ